MHLLHGSPTGAEEEGPQQPARKTSIHPRILASVDEAIPSISRWSVLMSSSKIECSHYVGNSFRMQTGGRYTPCFFVRMDRLVKDPRSSESSSLGTPA
mmetsp:Transcript_41023/g.80942  ORF Transcript_41023/g.80942 Transcript_41023/m.80942 type:complete len:98 (+) Transcript_41023:1858-2151(+)